jgi:hypothetical protein
MSTRSSDRVILKYEVSSLLGAAIKKSNREGKLKLSQTQSSLGKHLGVGPRTIRNWTSGVKNLSKPVPAYVVPLICKALKNYEAMNRLENAAGRIAYVVPDPGLDKIAIHDVRAIQQLTKEVSEALGALADTLKDGIVTNKELKATIPELDDVIKECAKLKHWLTERNQRDNSRRKNRTKKRAAKVVFG